MVLQALLHAPMNWVTSSICTEGEKDNSDVYGTQETKFGDHPTVSSHDASKNNTKSSLLELHAFLPHSLEYIQWCMKIPLSNFNSPHRFISTHCPKICKRTTWHAEVYMHEAHNISVLINPVEPCNHLIVEGLSSLKQKCSWIFLQTISHLISLSPLIPKGFSKVGWVIDSFIAKAMDCRCSEWSVCGRNWEWIHKQILQYLSAETPYRIIRFIHKPRAE